MKPDEIRKVGRYLRTLLGNAELKVKAMPRKSDSAEVYVGEEFVGTLGKDVDEGETSYHVTMTILDVDLD